MTNLETPLANRELPKQAAVIRHPVLADARDMRALVEESETLDVNSLYLYLLLCRDFSLTCRVAELNGEIAGFVTAYIPPNQPQILFIWQIAVAAAYRGQGIAMRMLMDLLAALPESRTFTIEATVTPSNIASEGLFKSLARRLGSELRIDTGFPKQLFAPAVHEPERMFYIGPLVAGPRCGTLKEDASS
jgi:L-2,4-diaminobutyric acid acetyltransferase